MASDQMSASQRSSRGHTREDEVSAAVVAQGAFILATRDTGYRDLSAALAELIDNAIQAEASAVSISIGHDERCVHPDLRIAVLDNGRGMAGATLREALRFGGTNRFGDRSGLGRFGMGLPNSSVSQARRLEVYSWQDSKRPLYTYLDVDEVASGTMVGIPRPARRSLPRWALKNAAPSGTLVIWTHCDRLSTARVPVVVEQLRRTLGRVYRTYLWHGVTMAVNGERVMPSDPLFVDSRAAIHGARAFGAPLRYEITTSAGRVSTVEVRFSELPLSRWAGWSDDEKRAAAIVGGSGVSVLRAGREIDYGWYFMGRKRRENYDDWWRCEVTFSPELDELFGVTHNKQGINPETSLSALLGADLEPIARELNARVRRAFQLAKSTAQGSALRAAASRDRLLPPPASAARRVSAGGLKYALVNKPIPGPEFYSVQLRAGVVKVTMNSDHPFFGTAYERLCHADGRAERDIVERLLLAAARADLEATTAWERKYVSRLRRAWSDALAAFLEVR